MDISRFYSDKKMNDPIYVIIDKKTQLFLANTFEEEEAILDLSELKLFWCDDKENSEVMLFATAADAIMAFDEMTSRLDFFDGKNVCITNRDESKDQFFFTLNSE